MNGITREKVIKMFKKLEIPIFQKNFSLVDAYSAEELLSQVRLEA